MLVYIGLPFEYINMHVLVKMFELCPFVGILSPIFNHVMKTSLLLLLLSSRVLIFYCFETGSRKLFVLFAV